MLLVCITAQSQVTGTTGGIAPFGSYTDDVLGAINAANLNVRTVIPMRQKGKFFAELGNDNNRWAVVQIASGTAGLPVEMCGVPVLWFAIWNRYRLC